MAPESGGRVQPALRQQPASGDEVCGLRPEREPPGEQREGELQDLHVRREAEHRAREDRDRERERPLLHGEVRVRRALLRPGAEGAEAEHLAAGAAHHRDQVPEQDRGVEAAAERGAARLLRRQEPPLPQLHLRVQEHRDPAPRPQPGERREARGGHQVQVPNPQEQHPGCRDPPRQDQPDHPREEPQPPPTDPQVHQERMILHFTRPYTRSAHPGPPSFPREVASLAILQSSLERRSHWPCSRVFRPSPQLCNIVFNNRVMVNKLMDGVSFLKSKLQADELEEKLNEAVSEENWQASTQLLHEIANAAFNYEKEQRVLAFLWEKLKHKSWKRVLKTLHLADFLLRNGPTSLVNALKENIYEFRNFDNYALVADGIDRGESIRKQSRAVVALLSDDHFLSDERAKAKQIKDRMANVIGSAAYYGSFSNDGTSIPPSKKDTYESFSASSFNKSSGPGGMSFGESVMRSLQQAKKQEERFDLPPPEEKPASKLNFSKMNLAKPEEKKSFNTLSMKLVKPPEKKPAEKKPEQFVASPQKPQPKPQQKPAGKLEIMDIDFLSGSSEPKQEHTVNSSSSSNPFDLLGAPTSPVKPISHNPQAQQALPFSDSLFGPTAPTGQSMPLQASSPLPASNFLYGSGNHVTSFNYVPPASQSLPFNFAQPSAPTVPAAVSISLSVPAQPKANSTSPLDLIDFSNFRQELAQSGQQEEKKSIVEQWTW